MKRYEQFAWALRDGGSVFAATYVSGVELKPCRALKRYYVYLLIDPRTNKVFYVGKGKGFRATEHLTEWKSGNVTNAMKFKRIGEIIKSGMELVVKCLQDDMDGTRALDLEGWLIRTIGRDNLTNLGAGRKTAPIIKIGLRADQMLDKVAPFRQWEREILPYLTGSRKENINYYWWLACTLAKVVHEGKQYQLEAS